MRPDERRLETLADLLDAGHSPLEALLALERLGGALARWARPLITGVRSGAPLGMILAQAGVLSSPELIWVGGAEHAGRASSLRVVSAHRRARRERRRALWAAMLVPAVMTVLSAGSGRFVLGLLGSPSGGVWGDVLPLALIAGGVAWGLMDRRRNLVRLKGVPLVGRWVSLHQQACIAEALGAGLSRPGGEALALEAASRLADAPVLAQIASRVRQGTPFAECLPRADDVGEALALCIASGHAGRNLPSRLASFAAVTNRRVTDKLRRVVRLLVWCVLIWVNLRILWAFADVSLLGDGAGMRGMPMMPGGLPGVDTRELNELMREIGM